MIILSIILDLFPSYHNSSKSFGKLFDKRLSAFVEKNSILTDSQYGFRNKRSTSLALIELVEKLTANIDSKKVTVGVFIDLKGHLTNRSFCLAMVLEDYPMHGCHHA